MNEDLGDLSELEVGEATLAGVMIGLLLVVLALVMHLIW